MKLVKIKCLNDEVVSEGGGGGGGGQVSVQNEGYCAERRQFTPLQLTSVESALFQSFESPQVSE